MSDSIVQMLLELQQMQCYGHCPGEAAIVKPVILKVLSIPSQKCLPRKKKREREKKFLLEHTFKISFYPFF